MKKISANHAVEEPYLQAVIKEWDMYMNIVKGTPVIRQVHLGGGTPTYFSPENLALLLDHLLNASIIHKDHSFSIEGHPNNTTEAHLKVLYERGFRRISFGVQDNDKHVQHLINRIQPFENVERVTMLARTIGFTSINFDLIYGLPGQTIDSIVSTVNECLTLKPDRIAFYSYAHVPWTSKSQRLFDETDLPSAEEKLALYLAGKEVFLSAGYKDIGMDHFALPSDELYIASINQTLYRSFMGYSANPDFMLLGLGVSSISDMGSAFYQNKKTLSEYYQSVHAGQFPIQKGYFLTPLDRDFRKYILDISCRGYTRFKKSNLQDLNKYVFPALTDLTADGLINWTVEDIQVTALGKHFIRNICSAFDLHLIKSKEEASSVQMYSKAI
jgi:oxygen-independent coproporphyrinogen-3 oxidase